MTISDFLMVSAVLSGPIIAVQLTRFLDDRREVRNRKLQIFKSLMATRAYTMSWIHVEALNRIDLEFDKQEKSELEVIEAWKAYLDLLNNSDKIPAEQWIVKRTELFVEMLHKMALVLDYTFDKPTSKTPLTHLLLMLTWKDNWKPFVRRLSNYLKEKGLYQFTYQNLQMTSNDKSR